MLGVGAVLEVVGCSHGEWMIIDSAWGNIGSGYIGKDVSAAVATAEAASSTVRNGAVNAAVEAS